MPFILLKEYFLPLFIISQKNHASKVWRICDITRVCHLLKNKIKKNPENTALCYIFLLFYGVILYRVIGMCGGTLMFIECYKNNGIPYLRLVRSIRRPSKNNPDKISTNF